MTAKTRGRGNVRAVAPPRVNPRGAFPTAPVIACAVFVLCAAWVMPFMPDDSFISFRYAEHLADGHGIVFNIGSPPVEAYSNLLWILLCAAFYKLGMDLPSATPVLGILLGLASLAVFWDVVRRRAPHWTQQLPVLLALASFGPFVIYVVSGMETVLFALLLLLVVRFAEDVTETPTTRALVWFTVVGFLTSLARPEGVIVFPIALAVIAWQWRGERRLAPLRRSLVIAVGAFVIATALYHLWRISYFDAVLPTPFFSKGGEGQGLLNGWKRNFDRYFLGRSYYSPPDGYAFIALIFAGFAGLRLARTALVRTAADRVALVIGLVLAAAYFNFVDWMPGMRYHAALAGVLLVPARNLHRLRPEENWRAAAGPHRGRLTALCVALLLASGVGFAQLRHATVKLGESAEVCNLPLAEWLRDVLPSGSVLAMGDVGVVPYYTHLRTIDINPESLTDAHIAHGAFSAGYVLKKAPEAIVLSVRGVYAARMDPLHWELYKSEEFRDAYGFVGTVRQHWANDRAYWVFVRKDVPVSEAQVRALPEGMGLQQRTRLDP